MVTMKTFKTWLKRSVIKCRLIINNRLNFLILPSVEMNISLKRALKKTCFMVRRKVTRLRKMPLKESTCKTWKR